MPDAHVCVFGYAMEFFEGFYLGATLEYLLMVSLGKCVLWQRRSHHAAELAHRDVVIGGR